MTSSTQSMQPIRCVKCNRIIAYGDGNVSVRCRHCKSITITAYVDKTSFQARTLKMVKDFGKIKECSV